MGRYQVIAELSAKKDSQPKKPKNNSNGTTSRENKEKV